MGVADQMRPDGTWGPAKVYPWTDGIDWECYAPGADGRRAAHAYWHSQHLATVHARTRLGLQLRMVWAQRRLPRA